MTTRRMLAMLGDILPANLIEQGRGDPRRMKGGCSNEYASDYRSVRYGCQAEDIDRSHPHRKDDAPHPCQHLHDKMSGRNIWDV